MDNKQVQRAWENFVSGDGAWSGVRDAVIASWERSRNHVVPISRGLAPLAEEGEIHRQRSLAAALVRAARPAFDRSSAFLRDADAMMILTDATGMIIETQGDERTIDNGRSIHLQYGGSWLERDIGTNAIGTAMAVAQPVQIHGAEHFCTDIKRWTCAAAPIRHPIDREVLGIVDISGPASKFVPQSLALAVAVSHHIEDLLERSVMIDHQRLLQRAFAMASRWPSDEMIVVDRRGAIVHLTDDALQSARRFRPEIVDNAAVPILRTIPIGEWKGRLRKVIPNASVEPITDDGSQLGAIIVLRAAGNPSRKPPSKAAPLSGAAARRACSLPMTNFVADDPAVGRIVRQVESAASRQMAILIRGETGTGKEQLARHAHAASGRRGAFVPVNCAALPESLIEAELFGYVEGAFTGARRGGSVGLVKEADGGTLFLDEIGDMPIGLQAVLLRLLDDWTVRPIGGARSTVDVLLVSATNAKLDAAIAAGRFRSDLLYRLNTLEVTLPPLGARGDFEAIVRHLLAAIDPNCEVTRSAVARLAERSWPGNIRELRNMLARATLAASDNVIDEASVEAVLGKGAMPSTDGCLFTVGEQHQRDSSPSEHLPEHRL
jgi:sigma-54 dependent transcriptional regulator, acetoin dehydrogenase operon transcriptional activator AcoR